MGSESFHGDGFFAWQQVVSSGAGQKRYGFDADKHWGGFSRDPEKRSRPFPEWALGPVVKYGGKPCVCPRPQRLGLRSLRRRRTQWRGGQARRAHVLHLPRRVCHP